MKKKILSLILSLTLLTGCATANEDTGSVLTGDSLFQEGNVSWEIDYEVPVSKVNVLIDRNGYYANREKEVIFRGEGLSDTFDVIDVTTKESVFTGKVSDPIYNEASGEYVSHGDFSDLITEGTYYIETDIIGRSYPFRIGNKIYDDVLHNMENVFTSVSCVYDESGTQGTTANCPFHDQEVKYSLDGKRTIDISGGWHTNPDGSKNVKEGCMSMTALALSITYYGNVLQSEENTKEQEKHNLIQDLMIEANWLLKMQDSSGGVYAGVQVSPNGTGITLEPVSYEATASFAGAMALCAQLLQSYDSTAARTCETAAKKAWSYLSKQTCDNESARFYAAGWLYRLTGEKTYLKALEDSLYKDVKLDLINNRFALYGKVAYISTERKIDTEICAAIMMEIMDAAEESVTVSRKDAYYIYSQQNELCMERMLIVSIANYVTPSNEYVKVLRSYVHYLFGRNTDGYQYMNEDGSLASMKDATHISLEWNPIMLLTMCGIVDAESEE